LQLRVAGAGLSDDTYLYIEAGATASVDAAYDAVKLPNSTGLNLASLVGNTRAGYRGGGRLLVAPQPQPTGAPLHWPRAAHVAQARRQHHSLHRGGADAGAVLHELGRHQAAPNRGQDPTGCLSGQPLSSQPAAGHQRGHARSTGARRLVDSHYGHSAIPQLPT
nr:hypothetical protein [Tanacetum cinerariifolium]